MSPLTAPLLAEFKTNFFQLPPKDKLTCIIIRIASCIPILGALTGIGYVLEGCRLKKLDPSLETIGNQLILRGVLCILGLGVLTILQDHFRSPPQNEIFDIVEKRGYESTQKALTLKNLLSEININITLSDLKETNFEEKLSLKTKTSRSALLPVDTLIEQARVLVPLLRSRKDPHLFIQLTSLKPENLKLVREETLKDYHLILHQGCTVDVNTFFSVMSKTSPEDRDDLLALIVDLSQFPEEGEKDVTPLLYLSLDDILKIFCNGAPLFNRVSTFNQKLLLLEWLIQQPHMEETYLSLLHRISTLDEPTVQTLLKYLPLIPDWKEIHWSTPLTPENLIPLSSLESHLEKKHYRFLLALSQGALRDLYKLDDTSPLVKKAHAALMKHFIHRIPQRELDAIVKNFYQMVLDSKKSRPHLDGGTTNETVSHITDYLTRYLPRAHNPDKVALLIDKLRDSVKKHTGPPTTLMPMLILGGTSSHAVAYSIEQDPDGTYSFTLYNSGEGATRHPNGVISPTYTHLTEKQLSPSFFASLYDFESKDVRFATVAKFIDDHLNLKTNLDLSKKHTEQNHGSCPYKCLSHYLHDTLGDQEWRSYKVFLTELLLHRFSSLPKSSNPEYYEMQVEGYEVLHKRFIKAKLQAAR